MDWETGIHIYALLILCIKYITGENLLYSPGHYPGLFSDLNGKEIQNEKRRVYTYNRFTLLHSRN